MRIYVCCPPRVITGGIELLHQLTFELNRQVPGIAKILYLDQKPENGWPMPPQYEKYGTSFVVNEYRRHDAVCILPEVWAGLAESEFEGYKTILWWESVDNYFASHPPETWMSFAKNKSMLHMVQSEYAWGFLTANAKVSEDHVLRVSDYLGESFLKAEVSLKAENRKPYVLYNPRKGIEFTRQLIEASPDLQWVPISGMPPEKVAELMAESRVYVDFGDHPGKDRIPREAAISGCCVITGRNGSATYPEDVPISGKYKFQRDKSNIPQICDCVRTLVNDYDSYISDFAYYRSVIREEPSKFEKAVEELIPVVQEYCQADRENLIEIAVYGANHRSAAARELIEGLYDKWLKTTENECRFEVSCYVTEEVPSTEYGEISVIDPEEFVELYNSQSLAGIVFPGSVQAEQIRFVADLVRRGVDINDIYRIENKWLEASSVMLDEVGLMLMPWLNRQ